MTLQLGFNTTVVASSAEMARQILQKQDQAFLGRPVPDAITAETDYELSMAWLQGGPQWRKLRKLCNTQIFTTQRLDALQELRHQMMDAMLGTVAEACGAGMAVSIGRLVFGTSLSLLSNTMLSVDIIDPKSNAIEELKELVSRIMKLTGKPNISDYFPLIKPFDLQHIKRDVKVSYDHLHVLLQRILDQRLERRAYSGSDRCNDFLDVLLDHNEEHGHEELNLKDIKVLLTHLFIGGTDTTTTTLEWAMAELIRNPNIMAKVKQELAETIGMGQNVKEKDIPKLGYLQAVLKESMRLHSTSPFLLPHCTMVDAQVSGYTIPKGTQVLINSWAISKDPMNWENPTQFIPERFMDAEVDFRGTNFSFIPFGSGRRICPGLNLAVRMLMLLLASLIHHFDWKLPEGMEAEKIDMKDKFGITMHKALPLVAIPLPVAASI